MRSDRDPRKRWSLRAALYALGIGLAMVACTLDEVEIPGLIGPAGLSDFLVVRPTPDWLLADGVSTSLVRGELRDKNGRPVAGRDIVFQITNELGEVMALGRLSSRTARTGGNGFAEVIYTAPPPEEFRANAEVLIRARPISDDSGGQQYRMARIELRSVDDPRYRPRPTNQPPLCSFLTHPRTGPYFVGVGIPIQSTSADEDGYIVRWEWDLGDGTRDDRPELTKVYTAPGVYTITHVVTDNEGAPQTCGRLIGVR